MQKLMVKKGYRFKMAGAPSDELVELPAPDQVAVLPERIPHIKPRLRVKKGDRVRIGSPLFEDKRNPDFIFLSPGGGTVRDIVFGPRRVIQAIIIDRETDPEPEVEFPPPAGRPTKASRPGSAHETDSERRHVVGLPGAAVQGYAGTRIGATAYPGGTGCQGTVPGISDRLLEGPGDADELWPGGSQPTGPR